MECFLELCSWKLYHLAILSTLRMWGRFGVAGIWLLLNIRFCLSASRDFPASYFNTRPSLHKLFVTLVALIHLLIYFSFHWFIHLKLFILSVCSLFWIEEFIWKVLPRLSVLTRWAFTGFGVSSDIFGFKNPLNSWTSWRKQNTFVCVGYIYWYWKLKLRNHKSINILHTYNNGILRLFLKNWWEMWHFGGPNV